MTESEILDAAYHTWGLVPQMLMVGEESVELAHAIFKWNRARRRLNEVDAEMDLVERKAIQRAFKKAEENVIDEAMDVRLMLRQLEVMLPGKYVDVYEEKLMATVQKLRNEGVQI